MRAVTRRGARCAPDAHWRDAVALIAAPLLGAATQLVDLYGEGLPGFLTLEAGAGRPR
ncbi:MAG: hypothetical protein KF729_12230 [Sandaracinaceae bacterium]|nr:hypothetical protein [Sandaracinaceae bacterium]